MKIDSNIILILVAILFLSACNPTYYIPNPQNVTVFKSKGETRILASGEQTKFHLQGAYAFSDHFAFQTNLGFHQKTEELNSGGGVLGELGIGYYQVISEDLVFECYALGAVGSMKNEFVADMYYPERDGIIKANVTRLGIQPSIAYTSEFFEAAFSTRIARLHYSNIRGNLINGEINEIEYLKENDSSTLLEPAITLRAGVKNIKFQYQILGSINMTHPDFKQKKQQHNLGVYLMF